MEFLNNNLTEEQDRERYKICGVNYDDCNRWGGVVSFEGLSCDALKELVEKGYADPEECQNCSPSIQEFIDFMEEHPDKFEVNGYIVVKERNDCRVSVEAICSIDGVDTCKVRDDFIDTFRFADDFHFRNDWLYAWWD